MIDINKTLIVAANGQNSGKTTLICKLINTNKNHKIIAVKISPHFHKITNNSKKIAEEAGKFGIYEEVDLTSKKDSSLMLKSGAEKVYYVQATDEYLPQVLDKLNNIIPDKYYVIIESGGIAKLLNAKLIYLKNKTETKPKNLDLIKKADYIIDSFSDEYNTLHTKISFNDNKKTKENGL